ncbi:MAG: hypothetical protein FJX76_27200 [Armatimonadetes bacterium]|nr:hypothetical protein [Armatimonadota bacterium]
MLRTMDAASTPPRGLDNLKKAGATSKEIKDEVVDPLRRSVNLAGTGTGLRELGIAGSALGGVYGIQSLLRGVVKADPGQVLGGTADIATSLGTFAALGVIGGAPVLTPVASTLLMLRGAHRGGTGQDHITRLNGLGDVLVGATLACSLASASPAVTVGLGVSLTATHLLRGLARLHSGHEKEDVRMRIKGTGEIIVSAGLLGIATGPATAPGVLLVALGVSLPVLQRIPSLRPRVDAVVHQADRALYPAAKLANDTAEATARLVSPLTSRLAAAVDSVDRAATPVTAPVRAAWDGAMLRAARGLESASDSRLLRLLDRGVGALQRGLLPEPPSGAPAAADSGNALGAPVPNAERPPVVANPRGAADPPARA